MTTKKLTATQQLEKIYGPLTFGGFLNSWRLSEEMNQTQFAKFLGLSVQNLNDIEKGRRIPSPTRAAKIARKLQLPEEGLIAIALRDSLKKEGFNFYVSLESAV